MSSGPPDPFEARLAEALRRYADDGIRGWPASTAPPAGARPRGLGRVLAYVAVGVLAAVVTVAGLTLTGVVGHQPPPAASGSVRPTPVPGATLAHFDDSNWSFDYPATWKYFPADNLPPSSFSRTIGFLATIDLDVSSFCQQTANATSCKFDYPLTPGTLVVAITADAFPGSPLWSADAPHGKDRVTVAGMPALYRLQHLTGGEDVLSWQIARPDAFDNYYTLTAHVKGPGADALRSEVLALVASVRFNPPVVPLPTEPTAAAQAAARAMAALRALRPEGPSYACFPDVPGTSSKAIIWAFPNSQTLRKPLPVVCSMKIETTDLQLWKMTLEFSWEAAADRQAGRWVITQWVTRTGELSASVSGGVRSSNPPYQ